MGREPDLSAPDELDLLLAELNPVPATELASPSPDRLRAKVQAAMRRQQVRQRRQSVRQRALAGLLATVATVLAVTAATRRVRRP